MTGLFNGCMTFMQAIEFCHCPHADCKRISSPIIISAALCLWITTCKQILALFFTTCKQGFRKRTPVIARQAETLNSLAEAHPTIFDVLLYFLDVRLRHLALVAELLQSSITRNEHLEIARGDTLC